MVTYDEIPMIRATTLKQWYSNSPMTAKHDPKEKIQEYNKVRETIKMYAVKLR